MIECFTADDNMNVECGAGCAECYLSVPFFCETFSMTFSRLYQVRMKPKRHHFCFSIKFLFFSCFFPCARSRGGVPPLHAAVPRGAAPRGAPPSRAPTSRGRGVQRARGAPPAAGYRPAPPIVQETYGEYVSASAHAEIPRTLVYRCSHAPCRKHRPCSRQTPN